MRTFVRKTLAAGFAALTIGGAVAASTTEASAQWRRHHHHHRGGWGGPAAAGVIGGLALGALAGSAYAYGAPGCQIQRRPAYDHWGRFVGYQRVRVCY